MLLSEDGGPLTDNAVFTAISEKRFLGERSRAESPNRSILGQALRDDRKGVKQVSLYVMTISDDCAVLL